MDLLMMNLPIPEQFKVFMTTPPPPPPKKKNLLETLLE